jgi:hypothetical protein
VEKFPARCEETSQNSWYITLQKSETVHRNLPIRLSNDVDIAQSRWTLPPHNLYGYEYQVPDAFLACVPKARLLIPGSGLLGSDFLVLSQRNNIFTDSTWSIPGFLDSNDATGILLYPRIRYCPEAYGILGIRLWEEYYHMVFAPPNTTLIELHPSRYIIPCFWGLASLCRHRYAYLIGPSVSDENYGGLTNFYISLNKLQMLLDKVMNME